MSNYTIEDYLAQLKSADVHQRRNAAWNLGRFRDISLPPLLIEALNDEDASVRLRVTESLGNFRFDYVIDPLIQRLLNDPDVDVRAMSAISLGHQGTELGIDPLVTALTGDEAQVRIAAADALGKLNAPQAAEPLVAALVSDDDENVRYSVSRALVQLGIFAVEPLIHVLDEKLHPETKTRIAETLGQLGDARAIEPLQKLAEDEDEIVAETAKWALARLRHR